MSLLVPLFRFLLKLCGPSQEEQKPPQQQQQQHYEQPVSYPPPQHQQQQQQQQYQQHQQHQFEKPYHHNDYLAHAQDPHYTSLRQQAAEIDEQMDQLFDASRAAYSRGEGAEAKELSNRAKGLKSEKERLDREAAVWIFEQNNKGREPEEVDLHGLRAEEAIERTEQFIIDCRKQGLSELRLIVGKGLHSQNHEAVLKPRIEELMKKHNIIAELDPENSGVLLVHLDGGEKARDRAIDSEEITRRLGDDEKSCIIM